jgi:hypothetical protein
VETRGLNCLRLFGPSRLPMDEISAELHCEATHDLGIGLADPYLNGRIYGPTRMAVS